MQLIKRLLSAFREVALQASEKLALLAASNTDGYEKREVLKDTKLIQKTQAHQGQGVSYTDCKVEGRLKLDTPALESSGLAEYTLSAGDPGGGVAAAAPGSRTLGAIEVAPREEFSHTHHVLENRVEERSGPVQKSLKSGFKAALGVGVAALGVATGGIGSGIVGTLATTAITSSAVSFVNHGLESVMNHESVHIKDILKDVGKSLAVAGITQGLSAGLTELTSEAISEHSLSQIALRSLAHHGVYRQNLIQIVASQGIAKAAELGAGQIGEAYQGKNLNWASHKLIHGALAMASTLGYGAIQGETTNWSNALIAATAVMGAETAAEEYIACFESQLPRPQADESEDSYIERFEAETQHLAQKTIGCLRVLSAAGLTLAGQDASTITAADSAVFNGLENNFYHWVVPAAMALLSGLEVYDAAEQVEEAVQQGETAQAALIAGKAAIKVLPGMGIAKGVVYASETFDQTKAAYQSEGLKGVGKVAGEKVLGRRVSRLTGKGLRKLMKRDAGNLTGGVKTRSATKALGDGGKHVPTAEEKAAVEKYFTEYREKKFVVDTYGGRKIDGVQEIRNDGKKGRTVKHHVGTHKNNEVFVDKNIHKDKGVSILIPKEWHKDFVHGANKVQHENFRQALFTSIKEMRRLPERMNAGALREEVRKDLNEALLEAIKKNKELFPEHLKK